MRTGNGTVQKISFLAQLDPGVKNAVGFDTHGASNIKLVASASELSEVIKLAAYGKDQVWKVTFEKEKGKAKIKKENRYKKETKAY